MQTNQSETPRSSSGRRHTAIGVTAGLLGGGAIGLMMTVPALTSAASAETEPAVVALQDGTDDSGDAVATETAEHPERGERLRELLQPLVDDSTITDAQADAVTAHLIENRPERDGRGERRGKHRGAFDGEVVAGLIGIDVEMLRDEMRSGKSIADIATENGASVDAIVAALVDEVASHLDTAVENGRLTDEEAAEKLDGAEDRITARVNGERPVRN